MKTKLIFSIILSAFSLTLHAQTPIPGGEVSGTWDLNGSPYLIEGEIIVPEGDILAIEPGVTVQFQGHFRLLVLGQLLAIGTQTDSIRFTPLDTSIGWRHIYLMNDGGNTDTSKLYYCIVEYGKPTGAANPGENTGGGISIENANAIISHCLIQHNYCSGDNPISPPIGGGISVAFSDPIIEYCTIINNQAEGPGGAIGLARNCNPSIMNCTLSSNSTQSDGGGIMTQDESAFTMKNTIIEGSLGGSGIYFENPDLVQIDISYCDFNNNAGGDFTGDVPVALGVIIGTNNNGDPCDPYSNIFLDPLFVAPEGGDFHLLEDSPCINAGDPNFPHDPDGSICEIGAFYYGDINPGIQDTKSELPSIKCYPNPAKNEITILTDNGKEVDEVCIYTLAGQKVLQERFVNGSIDISHLQPGMYIVEVTIENTRIRKKLMVE